MAEEKDTAQRSAPGREPGPDAAGGDRSATRRSFGPARGPLLLFAVVVAMAVAAVCLRAGGSAPLGSEGPLHSEWLLVAVVLAGGGWYLTAKYYARQSERPMGTPREGRLVTLTVTALVLTAVGTFAAVSVIGTSAESPQGDPAPAVVPPSLPTASPRFSLPPQPPQQGKHGGGHSFPVGTVLLVLVIALLVAVLAALVVLALRRLGARLAPGPELVATLQDGTDDGTALSDAVSAGRLALQGEDVRAAVIACYAAMEDSLAAGGLGRRAADSPADLLSRATEAGLLVGLAPQQLAALFREARYSSHPMTAAELRTARAALDEIGEVLSERIARRRAEAEAKVQAETTAEEAAGAAAATAVGTEGVRGR